MKVLELWTIADNPPTAPDCFIVPSYAATDRFTPTRPTRAQIELVSRWWKRYPQASIIMSTGDSQGLGMSEAAIMARYAFSLDIPSERIIKEDLSMNTHENLRNSWQIVTKHGFRQPTIVAFDLHTRRVVNIARKLGWEDFYWLSAFSRGERAYGYKGVRTFSRPAILCYEIAVTVYSRIVGWL